MISCKFEDGNEASLRHVVTQAVIIKNGKILLGKRAEGLLEGGKWGLPGGFVDRDETIEEAIMREIMEETGWVVKNVKLLCIFDNPDRPQEDRQNIAFNFSCVGVEQEGEPDDESTEIKWFAFDDIPLKDLAFDHAKVVRSILKSSK